MRSHQTRYHRNEHLRAPARDPPGRTPTLARPGHEPNADPRGFVGARARGLRPLRASARPAGGAQIEARGGRDDHRLGGDRKHGGKARAPRVARAGLAGLRALVDVFQEDPSEQISEYSQANMEFHKAIIRLGGIELMTGLTDNLFIHMRAVRAVTMTQDNRAQRSIVDHRDIIAALERHDADLAARLVREHTMGLAAHVETHGDFLDRSAASDDERRRQYV